MSEGDRITSVARERTVTVGRFVTEQLLTYKANSGKWKIYIICVFFIPSSRPGILFICCSLTFYNWGISQLVLY